MDISEHGSGYVCTLLLLTHPSDGCLSTAQPGRSLVTEGAFLLVFLARLHQCGTVGTLVPKQTRLTVFSLEHGQRNMLMTRAGELAYRRLIGQS